MMEDRLGRSAIRGSKWGKDNRRRMARWRGDMISRQGFCALAVFFLAAGQARAADDLWTPVGPPGGIVTGLAFDGGTASLAYAATTGGFFRSTDRGASRAASNGGLRDAHLRRVVTMGAAVYVGGTDGVSRSDNRG